MKKWYSQGGEEYRTYNIKQEGKLDRSYRLRNCLLKHVILRKTDGSVKVTGRRRRCKQLLGALKEKRGY
jgi:hypothetical protein